MHNEHCNCGHHGHHGGSDATAGVAVAGGLILGLAVGALAGILFAPQSGEKTRKQVKDFVDEKSKDIEKNVRPIINDAKRTMAEQKERFVEQKDRLKDELQDSIRKVAERTEKRMEND
jgi:gas vesicle protein